MADEADRADSESEAWLATARAKRKGVAPDPNGFCANCDEPVPEGRRFCDVHCRDDWERRQ